MDITNIYTIDDRIRNELDTQISQAIRDNMYQNYWFNELDSKTTGNIQDELRILIKEAIIFKNEIQLSFAFFRPLINMVITKPIFIFDYFLF